MEARRKEKIEKASFQDSRVVGREDQSDPRGRGPGVLKRGSSQIHGPKYQLLKKKSHKALHTWHQKRSFRSRHLSRATVVLIGCTIFPHLSLPYDTLPKSFQRFKLGLKV